MQCGICQNELFEGSSICPVCQNVVLLSPEPLENTGLIEDTEPSVEVASSSVLLEAGDVLPTPAVAVAPLSLPHPIVPSQSKRYRKVWLSLAFGLLIVVLMSASSLFTLFFLSHNQTSHASASADSTQTTQAPLDYASGDPQTIYTRVTSKSPNDTDPLNDSTLSYWSTGSTSTSECQFIDGSFHVIERKPTYFYSCSSGQNYDNFAFQVDENLVQGEAGGIIFRSSIKSHTYYLWRIYSTGEYKFVAFNRTGSYPVLLEGSHLPYLKVGYNQKNTLTVIAYGSAILLYVNKHFVDRVNDSNYTSGTIGLLSYNGADTTDVSFTNAKFWVLS